MGRKVIIIDTSILCVYLQVPNMATCGPDNDRWDYERVNRTIEKEIEENATLVLPLATIIETGNHISHAPGDRYELAKRLGEIIELCIDEMHPWAAFSDQEKLWEGENLRKLARNWPEQAGKKISLGDATIADVAGRYAYIGNTTVEILTGDQGLREFTPIARTPIGARTPRRRR